MINARSVAIAILGAVLSAAPLIRAQDLKSSGSAAIQELALATPTFSRRLYVSDGFDPVASRSGARPFPVPGVPAWNDSARGGETNRYGTI